MLRVLINKGTTYGQHTGLCLETQKFPQRHQTFPAGRYR